MKFGHSDDYFDEIVAFGYNQMTVIPKSMTGVPRNTVYLKQIAQFFISWLQISHFFDISLSQFTFYNFETGAKKKYWVLGL